MKIFRLLFSLFILVSLVSCTENDEVITLKSLQLQFNTQTTQIPVHKAVEFTVSGNNYVDYTQAMTLKVNGNPVEGNTYTFAEPGVYTVQAVVENLNSNTVNFTVSDGLIVSSNSVLKNQSVVFTLFDVSTAEEITSQGQFYVNNNLINGNQFSSEQPGAYEVYATYVDAEGETQTSDVKTFLVVEPTQRVLIEDYTGTWCGYCPKLQTAIEDVQALTDDVVAVAVHSSSSDTNPDPFAYENVEALLDLYNPYGEFPMGRLDRTTYWQDADPAMVMSRVGGVSSIGIAATTTVTGDQLSVDVRVASIDGLHNLKMVVMGIENNLIHDQANYLNNDPSSQWYQAGNPIEGYENDHVLRHAMTNIFGDPIADTDALTNYTNTYTMTMSDYFANSENAEVVIAVLNQDGKVLQVKQIGLNMTLEFE